jgi:hypothetical protein
VIMTGRAAGHGRKKILKGAVVKQHVFQRLMMAWHYDSPN